MKVERKHEMGEGGYCFCPKCDTRVEHVSGVPCMEMHCPQCGAKLMREGSEHHRLLEARRAAHPKE